MASVGNLVIGVIAQTDDFERAMGRVSNQLNRFGGKVERAGRAITTGISLPAAAAAGSLIMATRQSALFADEIDKAAIRTGLSRVALQELRFAGDQVGVSFEGIQSAVAMFTRNIPQFEKGTGEGAQALRGLGVSLRDASGQLRPMSKLVPEVISKLSAMTNETERNVLATQIFGRGAMELVPMLAAGAGEIDRLRQRARELGLVMSEDSVKDFAKFKDSMEELEAVTAGLGRNVATALLPVIRDQLLPFVQNSLVPAIQRATLWFASWDESHKKLALGALAAAVALGPLVVAMGSVIKVGALLVAGLGSLVGLLAPGGLLVASALFVAGRWKEIWEGTQTIFESVVVDTIQASADWARGLWRWLVVAGSDIGQAVVDTWAEVVTYLKGHLEYWVAAGQWAVNAWVTLAEDMGRVALALADSVGATFAAMIQVVKVWLVDRWATIAQAFVNIYTAMLRGMLGPIQALAAWLPILAKGLGSGFVSAVQAALAKVGGLSLAWDSLKMSGDRLSVALGGIGRAGIAELGKVNDATLTLRQSFNVLVQSADGLVDQINSSWGKLSGMTAITANAMADSFYQFFTEGHLNVGEFVDAVLQELERLAARVAAMTILSAIGIPVPGFGGLFGGMFASGGTLPPGEWGIAGEEGPELIRGGRTGMTVAPLAWAGAGAGAGGGNITMNVGPITVTANGVQDPRRLADQVGKLIIKRIRGLGELDFRRPA